MSGLQFQTVPVAFTQGMDTRTQQKLVVQGKWLNLINYSLGENGSLQRRDGSTQIATASGNGLALHGSELLSLAGPQVSSYSPGQTALESKPGELGFIDVSKTDVQRANNMQDSPDCASGTVGQGTYTCYVWRDLDQFATATGIHLTLIDEATGVKLIDNFVARADAQALCPRVVFSSGAFFVFYISTGVLYCRVIDPTVSLTPGTETAMVSAPGVLLNDNFDACAFGSAINSRVLVVLEWSDGASSVEALLVQRSGTSPTVFSGPTGIVAHGAIAEANIYGLSCTAFGLTTNAGVFILHSGGVSGVVINTSLGIATALSLLDGFTPVAGFSHICSCLTTIGSTCIQVFSDQQANYGTAGLKPIRTGAWNSSLTPILAAATLINSASFSGGSAPLARGPQGPWICGKPFSGPATPAAGGNPVVFLPVCIMENTAFGTAAPNNNTQCSWFLLDCTTSGFTGTLQGTVVAKALYGSYGVPAINSSAPVLSTPCSSPAVGSGFATLVNERTALVVSNGLNISPTGLARITMTPNVSTPPVKTELGPVTFFAGGQLTSYDGSRITEHGFPLFPEGVGAKISSGAGMDDGVHQIVAVYEWTDAQGQRHQSSPSLPVSVTANSGASNNQATVDVPTLLLSQKPGVNIVLYMTQAAGTVFLRLNLRAGHPVANNTAAAFVTVTVTESDASISGNEALYTQPDQQATTLPNDAPPPTKALCVSQNRLWLLNEDSPLEYRYSQELLNGFGLQFDGLFGDETLGGLVPAESGGTIAVSPLDEKTIILCARKLYAIYGTGPDTAGDNSTFSEPQEIPSTVGCVSALSVLKMPQGLIFKAESGWYLLGRDLSVSYIGDGVKAYDSYTVMSATLMQDRQECRFEVRFPSSTDGVVLVFAYLSGQWSIFNRGQSLLHPVGASDALWCPAVSAYVTLTAESPVALFQDVPLFDVNGNATGSSADDFQNSASQVAVETLAQTSWLRLASLEGFQRVRRLYLTCSSAFVEADNADNFGIAVAFDDGLNSSAAYTVTGIVLDTTNDTIDLRHVLRHQKCKSVQFTFLETGTGLNAGVLGGIQALAMEIGIKKGVNKLSAAQTV